MKISRHYLTIKGPKSQRRVHYRKAGNGPVLLMVHQSPRSSAEYEDLMMMWGKHFTCIAPDTPGFGQSDPLPLPNPEIDDFADAIVEFAEAAGIDSILGYGFHSGGIILVTAMKRYKEMFRGLAIGGYAIWNEAERVKLGPPYIPPNPPKAFGEHLTWLWNRILEQSWYFPWFEPIDANRMVNAHDDPARIDLIIREMLDSGDVYRLGYGAVLRGPRDIPPADEITPPVRITAYSGDPLKEHLERLGDMPQGWEAYAVETPEDHHKASLEFLLKHSGIADSNTIEDEDCGFAEISTRAYHGLIHWQGRLGTAGIAVHAPGREGALLEDNKAIRVDLPGHGLSSPWPGEAPTDWSSWQEVIEAIAVHFGTSETCIEPAPVGDVERLFPDLTPDRFGSYLTRAWSIVRAQHIFAPWYEASADNIIPIDQAKLTPESLAIEHRALIRASAARAYAHALQNKGDN